MRVLLLWLLATSASWARDPQIEFFERRIRPVLVEQCASCHSANLSEPMGGRRVDSRRALLQGGVSGPAIVPGHPEQSLLLTALRYTDPNLKMPPTGKLSDHVLQDFATWISRGAADPRMAELDRTSAKKQEGPGMPIEEGRNWWAFQPLAEQPATGISEDGWIRRKIDAFVLVPGSDRTAAEFRGDRSFRS